MAKEAPLKQAAPGQRAERDSLTPRAVFSSPHVFCKRSSAQIMWLVNICLLPAALWGVWLFGWAALRVLLLSLLSTVGAELLINILSQRKKQLYSKKQAARTTWTLDDGSAVVSGLLLGMNLSPLVPWYIPIFGGLFAMLVCKWSFGGLGANWVNPALAGRAFVFFSFGREMSRWPVLQDTAFDAQTLATPLTAFKESLLAGTSSTAVEAWGQGSELQMLLGFRGGSLGEVATILLLAGGLALLALRIISWHIPLAYLASFALLTWVFGGLYRGAGLFGGEVLFHLFSGGLMLGAWFMATDYSSSPKMPLAKLLFGFGCGLLTFLVRFYGSYPEGVMLAILFMNIWTPTLDILIHPKSFGSFGSAKQKNKQKDKQKNKHKNSARRSALKLPEH